ncbi:MAG: thioredoxin-disulfide reductase [Candidatus Thermoplasmatota archaeon]|nr:thioredoxin-disulfide reductase [Candidatus Thermoplasmatota archaeon]MBU1941011.1 thioredoxin-disulfide reductase [Candidatus Thermoplasmatota archaeon]
MDYELAIIGAGPAGYSAGIYAVRAGINTIIFDKKGGGGLVVLSPNIENYPGFESISGADLSEKMRQHASKYAQIQFMENVKKIKKKNGLFEIQTSEKNYSVKAVLLCMGTEYRKLNVPGEKKLQGKGVSYCATCDGFFFKGKNVAVIGGGNSAVIEAIYLKQIGCKEVSIIHRRDLLRAEKAYQDNAHNKGINIMFNTHVSQINGIDRVESLAINNTKNGESSLMKVDGVFISIGEEPQNSIAKDLGVKLDETGYILVDKQQRTNIQGVYAAGDITGGLRQVITACAEGAIAALASTEVLGKQYPY